MQAKDLSDVEVLAAIDTLQTTQGYPAIVSDLQRVFEEAPPKVVVAKCAALIPPPLHRWLHLWRPR